MKTSALIVMFIMMALGKLCAGEAVSYVKAEGKTYLCSEVKIGLFTTKIYTLEGTIVKVPNARVDAVMHNSRLLERLPLICENNEVECMALMEYVASRSGLRLYKFTSIYEDSNPWLNKFGPATEHHGYYVFNDGKFYLRVNQKNAETVLPFFGLEVKF